jgi:hypothetical protein
MRLRPTIAASVLGLALQGAAASGALALAQIDIINADGPNEGFNSPTVVPAVPGNPATTRGAQRLTVFRAAADVWENVLNSAVPIRVRAVMDPLTPCSPTAGVLGRAGTTTVFRDFPGAPRANTWYPAALANRLAGSDQDPGSDDIDASFNSDVDENPGCLSSLDWWYGIGAPAPAGTISFFDTLLHELGHGLGVQSFVQVGSGVRFLGRDDIYMSFLEDHSAGTAWTAMTDAQRAASAVDTGDLHWTGNNVNACAAQILSGGLASGHVRIYAPNPVEPGSSVSHFDTALTPDELMEPFATTTSDQRLADRLLMDIGWEVNTQPCGPVHNPRLSHITTSSGHGFIQSQGHDLRLSHFATSSGHGFVQSQGHNPRLSHFSSSSGHTFLQSQGHNPRLSHFSSSSGHGFIQSQGHNPRLSHFSMSSGHDFLQSQGHDPFQSQGHNALLSGHDGVSSQGPFDPGGPFGPGGGPFGPGGQFGYHPGYGR